MVDDHWALIILHLFSKRNVTNGKVYGKEREKPIDACSLKTCSLAMPRVAQAKIGL